MSTFSNAVLCFAFHDLETRLENKTKETKETWMNDKKNQRKTKGIVETQMKTNEKNMKTTEKRQQKPKKMKTTMTSKKQHMTIIANQRIIKETTKEKPMRTTEKP